MFSAPGKLNAFAILGSGIALCSCTTSAPSAKFYGENSLRICRGMNVSNPPANRKSGDVVKVAAATEVNGVRLATLPVTGCLSSGFGRRIGGAGRVHEGVDISTRGPQPIAAAGHGVVDKIVRQRGYGLTIELDHGGGVRTRYAHLSRISDDVKKGIRVRAGEPIGFTGKSGNATGIHLHYEIIVGDRPINPLR